MVAVWATVTLSLAWAMTGLIRQYALRRSMVDVPNHRSSHTIPTPRGGGLAIVLAMVTAWGLMPVIGLGQPGSWSIVGAAVGVALVGFIDDHRHVPAAVRLLGHAAAAVVILWALGGLPAMVFAGVDLSVAPVGAILGGLIVAWWINLTNFMDGIDGIAGAHVVAVCLGGAWLNADAGSSLAQALGPLALAAATLGFLLWNWPPARIFMGDVGSGFVGAMIAVFTLQAGHVEADLAWAWMILSGAFVVDASVTLCFRVARRDRIAEAHRSHTYQHLATRWGRHREVTLLWTAVTLFWLLPCALAVANGLIDGWAGILIAYFPLIISAFWVQWIVARQPRTFPDGMLRY